MNVWTSLYPVSFLPSNIGRYFQNTAQFLYDDLKFNPLIIKKKLLENPKFSGHGMRVVESEHPYWYSEFYWANTKHKFRKNCRRRKLRGTWSVDKRLVFGSLEKIIGLQDKPYLKYDTLLRGLIKKFLIEGIPFDENEFKSSEDVFAIIDYEPENEVRDFFGYEFTETYKDERRRLMEKYGNFGEDMFYKKLSTDMGLGISSSSFEAEKLFDEVPF